jgi:hypothetical protein
MSAFEWNDRTDPRERIAHIIEMMEKYQAAKQVRMAKQALRIWRKLEADQTIMDLERLPERVH